MASYNRHVIDMSTMSTLHTTRVDDVPETYSFGRYRRPYVIGNVVIEDYGNATLYAYDMDSGALLWSRTWQDDEEYLEDEDGFVDINNILFSASSLGDLYYIRKSTNSDPVFYVFKINPETGAVIRHDVVGTGPSYGGLASFFTTNDYVVISTTDGDGLTVATYDRDDLSFVGENDSGELWYPSDPDKENPSTSIYSPITDTAIITSRHLSVWVDFSEEIPRVKGVTDNPLVLGRTAIPTAAGGMLSKTTTGSMLTTYSTDRELPNLRSMTKTYPSGHAGNPMTEGVYLGGVSPLVTQFIADPSLMEGHVVMDVVFPGDSSPSRCAVIARSLMYESALVFYAAKIEGGAITPRIEEILRITNPNITTGYGVSNPVYVAPIVETSSYLYVAPTFGNSGGMCFEYRINKSDLSYTTAPYLGGSAPVGTVAFDAVVDNDVVYLIGFDSSSYKFKSYKVDLDGGVITEIKNPVTSGIRPQDLARLGANQGGFMYGGSPYIFHDGQLMKYNEFSNTWSVESTYGYSSLSPSHVLGLVGDTVYVYYTYDYGDDDISTGYITYELTTGTWDQVESVTEFAGYDTFSPFLRLSDKVIRVSNNVLAVLPGAVYPY